MDMLRVADRSGKFGVGPLMGIGNRHLDIGQPAALGSMGCVCGSLQLCGSRAATFGFNRNLTSAFATANPQGARENTPNDLHLTVGLEIGNRNAGLKQEITIVCRGAGRRCCWSRSQWGEGRYKYTALPSRKGVMNLPPAGGVVSV